MDNAILVSVLLAVAAAATWFALGPSPLFVIAIENGTPRAIRGTVSPGVLGALAEICADCGVRTGTVRGVPEGDRIRLEFSRNLPRPFQQQVRNWWVNSGFSTSRSGPNRG